MGAKPRAQFAGDDFTVQNGEILGQIPKNNIIELTADTETGKIKLPAAPGIVLLLSFSRIGN
jgi:hypothetical protein